jgi:cell division protein FtsB
MVETMVKELRQRQRLRRFLYSWLSLGVLAITTFFLVKGAFGIITIERESAARVRDLESEAAVLALREEELKDEIERLKTPEGVIDAIKDKFSVTREGEYVAIIVDERMRASSTEKETDDWFESLWQGIKSLWEDKP